MCGPGEGASVTGCDDICEDHIKAEPTYVSYRWGKPLGDSHHVHNGSPAKLNSCNHSDAGLDAKDYASVPFADRQLCTPLLTKGTPPTNYGHALPHCNCCHLNTSRCLHKESIPSTNSSPARRTNTSSSDTLDKFPTNDGRGGGGGVSVGGTIGSHYLIFDPDVIPDQTRSNSSTSASNVRKPLSTFLGKKSEVVVERQNSFPMSILKQSSLNSQDSQDSTTTTTPPVGGTCPRHSGTNQIADNNQCNNQLANQQQQQQKFKDVKVQGLKHSEVAASMEDLENDANERKKLEVYTWK